MLCTASPLPDSLYTVVPYLVRFIDSLTNIYVRYNRKRLKVWSTRCSQLVLILLATFVRLVPLSSLPPTGQRAAAAPGQGC